MAFTRQIRFVLLLTSIAILSGVSADASAGTPVADASSATSALVKQYRLEAAKLTSGLESYVGKREFVFRSIITKYDEQLGAPHVVRVYKLVNRTVFDAKLGGIRSDGYIDDGTAFTPGLKPAIIDALNPEYRFQLTRPTTGPFSINAYSETNAEEAASNRWLSLLGAFYGTVAIDFNGNSLPQLLDSQQARIISARHVTYEGSDCVDLLTSRDFERTGVTRTVAGKVIVDPAQRWAIVYYEEQFTDGRAGREARNTFNVAITDVAFPKRVTLEDHDSAGLTVTQSDVSFNVPTLSHAKVGDFTLESVGLERPHTTSSPPASRISTALWINCVVAALLAIAAGLFYGRSKNAARNASL